MVKKDGLGKWNYNGSNEQHYRSYHDKAQKMHFEKCAKGATGDNAFVLRRIRSTHPSDPCIRRLVAFVSGNNNGSFLLEGGHSTHSSCIPCMCMAWWVWLKYCEVVLQLITFGF